MQIKMNTTKMQMEKPRWGCDSIQLPNPGAQQVQGGFRPELQWESWKTNNWVSSDAEKWHNYLAIPECYLRYGYRA